MPASRRSPLAALAFVALAGVLALPSGALAAKPVIDRSSPSVPSWPGSRAPSGAAA